MRKGLTVLLTVVLVLGTVSLASAQLINHSRRAKRAGLPPPPPPAVTTPAVTTTQRTVKPPTPAAKVATPVPIVTPAAVTPVVTAPVLPSVVAWDSEPQKVQNDAQKNSDINGDGMLQPFESKIYLRDMIDQVQMKGEITADTDILKSYDKNGDGKIDKAEIEKVVEEVGR